MKNTKLNDSRTSLILMIFLGSINCFPMAQAQSIAQVPSLNQDELSKTLKAKKARGSQFKQFDVPEDPEKQTVIYSHGFAGSGMAGKLLYTKGYEELLSYFYHDQKTDYSKLPYLFDTQKHNVKAFSYGDILVDLGIHGSIPNPFTSNLAQSDDIKKLSDELKKVTNKSTIGIGVSRGAATWLTTLGTIKNHKKIDCLVLESPFAELKNVALFSAVKATIGSIENFAPGVTIANYAIPVFNALFQSYDFEDIDPLKAVKTIDASIPILLMHSKQDAIIPINDSRKLYRELRKSGHEHVYLVEFEQGQHANVLWGPEGEKYCNIVHAFFKKYNLAHDAKRAHKINIKHYQPSIKKIDRLIRLQDREALKKAAASKKKISHQAEKKSSKKKKPQSFTFDLSSWL